MTKGGKMLKKYESMILISPAMNEESAKAENANVHAFIKENGGEVLNTDDWGKKRLAYEIQNVREGFYFINYFNFDPAKTTELDRYYKLNENIIRHNILLKS
ncbi:MAG TPA: 30S ribosomal protein S6 [Bacteroidetes bacterium]|nr:30S ribosomal protein S6 [Bacteroidota bacterium]